ncbi:MAG: DNA cytosine methyltransferase, partial [Bacteroidales bacterium]|nr:DNA cytosine methyltransferase [Bacteroidales bacterium]
MMKKKKYTFIDLFAGCGGLSEGFLQTGHFRALAHVEWELPMVNTLRYRLTQKWNYSEDEALKSVIQFDIQKTKELINGKWKKDSIAKFGENNHKDVINGGLRKIIGRKHVNLIIGGPPCQAYSIHGRATDKDGMQNDYRNFLFESFCEVVDAFKPDIFIFENVAGLLSAHPGGVPVRERIYKAFSDIGYIIKKPEELPQTLFNAKDFQVAQNRPRVIILGVRNNSNLELSELYASIENQKELDKHKTVRDEIGDLPPLYPLETPISHGRKKTTHSLNPDKSLTLHDARNHYERDRKIYRQWVENKMNNLSHKEMIDFYFKMTGHTTLYQKYKSLEWDKPSHTVVAHLCKDGHMFIHPDAEQERSITVREAACLMSFPRDYQFLGSTPYNYKMIGNAVPVKFAQ